MRLMSLMSLSAIKSGGSRGIASVADPRASDLIPREYSRAPRESLPLSS